jgi:hypothetical protein
MDSHSPLTERRAGALDKRRRLRLLAITLWSGFLGGALMLLAAIALLPADALHGAGWAELSVGFLCAWVLAMVPASLALLLGLPLRNGQAPDDGR